MNDVKPYNTYKLALLGIFCAIIAIQSFVPFLGYIPIQPFNPVIIHVTVIIGAVVLGPAFGSALGLVWGIICLFRAFVLPTSAIDPIVFTNPVVSVLPRVLVGLFAGYIFILLDKLKLNRIISMVCAGIIGSFTNTIFVLGTIYIFYKVPYANFYQMDVSALLPALLGVVATNGVVEAIVSAIIVPLVVKPLLLIYPR